MGYQENERAADIADQSLERVKAWIAQSSDIPTELLSEEARSDGALARKALWLEAQQILGGEKSAHVGSEPGGERGVINVYSEGGSYPIPKGADMVIQNFFRTIREVNAEQVVFETQNDHFLFVTPDCVIRQVTRRAYVRVSFASGTLKSPRQPDGPLLSRMEMSRSQVEHLIETIKELKEEESSHPYENNKDFS